jgi:hypothetical protein
LYSLVKTVRTDFREAKSPYHWLPEKSFHAVAQHNLALR